MTVLLLGVVNPVVQIQTPFQGVITVPDLSSTPALSDRDPVRLLEELLNIPEIEDLLLDFYLSVDRDYYASTGFSYHILHLLEGPLLFSSHGFLLLHSSSLMRANSESCVRLLRQSRLLRVSSLFYIAFYQFQVSFDCLLSVIDRMNRCKS